MFLSIISVEVYRKRIHWMYWDCYDNAAISTARGSPTTGSLSWHLLESVTFHIPRGMLGAGDSGMKSMTFCLFQGLTVQWGGRQLIITRPGTWCCRSPGEEHLTCLGKSVRASQKNGQGSSWEQGRKDTMNGAEPHSERQLHGSGTCTQFPAAEARVCVTWAEQGRV